MSLARGHRQSTEHSLTLRVPIGRQAMHRDMLIDCLPLAIGMIVCAACLRVLMSVAHARFQPQILWQLARDERGTVQSLSFVLTVPIFIMVLMFLVQLAQITMGRLVVEYAAFAAARSAVVWIPAAVEGEPANCIGNRFYRGEVEQPSGLASQYEIELVGAKAQRIHLAAASACLAICPSRPIENAAEVSPGLLAALWDGYSAATINPNDNASRQRVLANKMAYALKNTRVSLFVNHPVQEPPLWQYYVPPRIGEYQPNEIGWRDTLLVTVVHDYALLPGPGRLLATSASDADTVAPRIARRDRVYTYRLTANMTMTNEGQKATQTLWHE